MTTTTTADPARAHEYFANKLAFTLGPVELDHLIQDGEDIVIVDVRRAEDFKKGHVPNAINLPEDQWQKSNGLQKDMLNIFYCYTQTCHLAARAAERFSSEGYQVKEMEGGFEAWKQNGLKIAR
jgi:rhodanese-related sulfurtransferase